MDPAAMRQLLIRYAAAWGDNDREAWLDTFAGGATQEDPVGSTVRRGRAEIGAFWDEQWVGRDWVRIEPRAIHIAGDEAALEWTVTADGRSGPRRIDGVDVFTFAPGPLIATVRAYWR